MVPSCLSGAGKGFTGYGNPAAEGKRTQMHIKRERNNGIGLLQTALMLAIIAMSAGTAIAAPYSGQTVNVKQPDGTQVQITVWGDEFYHRIENSDGYTLVRDPNTGWLCYGGLSEDRSQLVSTGIAYKANVVLKNKTTPKHIELPGGIIREKINKRKKQLSSDTINLQGMTQAAQTGSSHILGLTLLIAFPDVPPTINKTEIENFLNQAGYTGNNNNGSVRDYFSDISGGMLEYTNHVTAYYTASKNADYYHSTSGAAKELILEALNWLENTVGFDFSTLSTNAGGQIIALNAYYAGAIYYGLDDELWPHSGWLTTFQADGVSTYRYQISNIDLQLRVFCHENGHMIFNWPDLYDYMQDSWGTGNYDLMAYGSNDKNPVPPNPYLCSLAGWQTITGINGEIQGAVLTHQANSPTAYRYSNPINPKEYFLIESRVKTGRNAFIPDEGLLIWHIDENGNNMYEQCTPSQHYMVSVEQADNLFGLENRSNKGGEGDLFHAGYADTFHDRIKPNANFWNGEYSGLSVTDISAVGPNTTFTIGEDVSAIPAISAYPKTIYASAVIDQITAINLTLSNNGGADLNYTANASVPWLDFSPLSGSVGPYDSNSIQVFIDAHGLSIGNYVSAIQITHNDIITENPLSIPLYIQVGPDRRLQADPLSADFGLVEAGSSSTRTITLINNSPEDVTVSEIFLSGKLGKLWAWGDNYYGRLGDGTTLNRTRPVKIIDNGVIDIAGGFAHSLAVKADGSLWTWGKNDHGQLGDDTITYRTNPACTIEAGVLAAAATGAHSFIVKANGSLWACGDNSSGQLGNGSTTDCRSFVQIIVSGVVSVSAGSSHTMIVKEDGSLWGWGDNSYGQLGDGTKTSRLEPVQILSSGIAGVSASVNHSMIIKTNGSLWACGSNSSGQFGNGTTVDSNSPVEILPFGVVCVSASYGATMIVKSDGSLWAAGWNNYGKFGDGTTNDRNPFVQIISSSVKNVSAGRFHTLITKTDGSLWACGANGSGQLGDGTAINRYSPVRIISSGVEKAYAADYFSLAASSSESGFNHTASLPLAVGSYSQCSFDVVFSPTQDAVYSDHLIVKSNASDNSILDVSLSGLGGSDIHAANPDPSDGAANVFTRGTALSWKAGSWATSHNVYFGTSNPPPFIADVSATSYQLPVTNYSTQYYWRIDEISAGGTAGGAIWSFTTVSRPDDCLTGFYKLNETSGTAAADSSGRGNTGTLKVEAGEQISNGFTWQPSSGVFAGAIEFDGDGPLNTENPRPYIEIPTLGMSPASGTAAFWAKLTDPVPVNDDGRSSTIYFFGLDGGSADKVQLYVHSGATLRYRIGGFSYAGNDGFAFAQGHWYHIAITWYNGKYVIYINGDPQTPPAGDGTYTQASFDVLPATCDIGNSGTTAKAQSFHGLLDDVRIYNRLLDEDEVLALSIVTGDINKDLKVNFIDLGLFADNWLQTGCSPPAKSRVLADGDCGGADFNSDTKVDLADFSLLASNWLN